MAIGEPPVARGYTPSVYALLPKLLERTGTSEKGAITGLYTVLEGDDMNEPVSDTVRGILDGHIVLSRELANAGHYPAIDVLSSVSRVMPDIVDKEHMRAADCVKNNMAVYRRAQDLINIGAYKKGTDAVIDRAIDMIGPINAFLRQSTDEPCAYDATKSQLMELIRGVTSWHEKISVYAGNPRTRKRGREEQQEAELARMQKALDTLLDQMARLKAGLTDHQRELGRQMDRGLSGMKACVYDNYATYLRETMEQLNKRIAQATAERDAKRGAASDHEGAAGAKQTARPAVREVPRRTPARGGKEHRRFRFVPGDQRLRSRDDMDMLEDDNGAVQEAERKSPKGKPKRNSGKKNLPKKKRRRNPNRRKRSGKREAEEGKGGQGEETAFGRKRPPS